MSAFASRRTSREGQARRDDRLLRILEDVWAFAMVDGEELAVLAIEPKRGGVQWALSQRALFIADKVRLFGKQEVVVFRVPFEEVTLLSVEELQRKRRLTVGVRREDGSVQAIAATFRRDDARHLLTALDEELKPQPGFDSDR